MAGLTDAGLEIPLIEDLLTEVAVDQISTIDANLNTQADSVLGNLNTIYISQLHAAWEELENAYQSAYPDTASGVALANVASITGTSRLPATKSRVTATLNLNAGTTVPAGSGASVSGSPTMQYETVAAATNSGGSAADVAVVMEAVEVGSHIFANSGTLTVIDTPVTGWNTVTNATASTVGTELETDAALRQRREEELSRPGTGTVPAIGVDMADLEGVQNTVVFANPTGVTDAFGLPPFSVEVILQLDPGFDPQTAHDQLLLSFPAGTEMFGSVTGTAIDSAGNSHPTAYSEPTEVVTYIELTLTEDVDTYPGDAAIADAIEAWAAANLEIGGDVYGSDIVCLVGQQEGVVSVDVSSVKVDRIASPVTADLAVSPRELATVASGNVTVTSI